jgi:hypothetical protein
VEVAVDAADLLPLVLPLSAPSGSPLANPHHFPHPELAEDNDITEALPEHMQDSLDHAIARGPLLLHRW